MIEGEELGARLEQVGRFVAEHRRIWQPRPFIGEPLPWLEEFPDVAASLERLPIEGVESLERRDPGALDALPARVRGWLERADRLSDVGACPARSVVRPASPGHAAIPGPERPPRRVKARKWRQVTALAGVISEAVAGRPPPMRWLEWCSGKAHLGRTLCRATGLPGRGLELDAELCASGRSLAAAGDPPFEFFAVDVRDAPTSHLGPEVGAVALHACGDLSDALLHGALEGGAALVAFAPCCPHRGLNGSRYEARSERGRQAGLSPGRNSLLLSVSGEHVGSGRVRRLRRASLLWRTAFDRLAREGEGRDEHFTLRSLPDSAFQGDFRAFAERMARVEGVRLPTRWDADRTLRDASERSRRARALGFARAPFRRPLELWTVLDRAERLREGGRRAAVGTFCPPSVTPRNLLVLSS